MGIRPRSCSRERECISTTPWRGTFGFGHTVFFRSLDVVVETLAELSFTHSLSSGVLCTTYLSTRPCPDCSAIQSNQQLTSSLRFLECSRPNQSTHSIEAQLRVYTTRPMNRALQELELKQVANYAVVSHPDLWSISLLRTSHRGKHLSVAVVRRRGKSWLRVHLTCIFTNPCSDARASAQCFPLSSLHHSYGRARESVCGPRLFGAFAALDSRSQRAPWVAKRTIRWVQHPLSWVPSQHASR